MGVYMILMQAFCNFRSGFHMEKTRPYGRFVEIHSNLRRKKHHKMNQGSNFLGGSFNNRDSLGAPI